MMDAKTYEQIAKSAKPFDRLKQFDPEYNEFLRKDALRSMLNKAHKTGTSQDPEEWVDDPVFSNPTSHKGFALLTCNYRKKYQCRAKEITTGDINYVSPWMDSAHEAGKFVVKAVDSFRRLQQRQRGLRAIISKNMDEKRNVTEIKN